MKSLFFVLLAGFLCLCVNVVCADVFGQYEIADFSNYNRAISLGSSVTESAITQQGGMNLVTLSGDNGYIKTDGGLQGFTYNSDWSWMTIIEKSDVSRIFMRGQAWVDKTGDFDLRMSNDNDNLYTWHRLGYRWMDLNSSGSTTDSSDLVWLASTYDFSESINRLYFNGDLIAEHSIGSMDDSNNTNSLNINGQWAGGARGVGNVYGEGTFDFGQLILSQSCFSQETLLDVYYDGGYMASDENTWLDIRVGSVAVPVPGALLLGGIGLGCVRLLKKRRAI